MGKNKPRWYPDKPQNNYWYCAYDDGTKYKECGYPWAFKCNGNKHMCKKLYFQHLASLSQHMREQINVPPYCESRTNYYPNYPYAKRRSH